MAVPALGIEPAAMGWNAERTQRPPRRRDRGSATLSNGGASKTQADRLIEIATGEGVELYHAPDGTAYADLDRQRAP